MNGQEENEVKEWVELLNESKEVTDQKIVEFNLANAEKHEEYWIYLQIEKHTGIEQCKGNCKPIINGAWIGYYSFNVDFSMTQYATYHILTNPISVLEITKGTNKPQFNPTQILREIEAIGNETGTGKSTFEFPANYTDRQTDRQTDRAQLILNPVSSLRLPWGYAKTANDDGKGTGGRRDERVENY